MNKLDPHTLFSIFEKGDEEIYEEHGHRGVLDNPFVLMNMVTRGLENYELMCALYIRNYPKEFVKVEPSIKLKYYNKLYGYLLRIDVNSIEDIYTIGESYERKDAQTALEVLLCYYEFIEQYEKCGVILKYIEMLVLEEAKYYIK